MQKSNQSHEVHDPKTLITSSMIVMDDDDHDGDDDDNVGEKLNAMPKLNGHHNLLPLTGCVITFSRHCKCELSNLKQTAIGLGAICQKYLSPKDVEMGSRFEHRASTHLICKQTKGEKYVMAKSWGLTCVIGQWLQDCQKSGKKLEESCYSVDQTHPDCSDFGGNDMSALPKNPVFMFCRFSSFEKIPYTSIIQRLGGHVCNDERQTDYDVLIAAETNQNFKVLTSLASGK